MNLKWTEKHKPTNANMAKESQSLWVALAWLSILVGGFLLAFEYFSESRLAPKPLIPIALGLALLFWAKRKAA